MYDEIRCPWCGAKLIDLWEYDPEVDGTDGECGSCGKPIVVGMDISYWVEKGNEEE